MDLSALASKARWSPRSVFPPSTLLSDRLFSCGEGLYLMTNPRYGDGDPVRSVGWAESDYWAQRAWENPPFRGDLAPPSARWRPPPSLLFLGRPESLSFASIHDFEARQPGARKATIVDASYRMTDGAFLFCEINGIDGVTYIFASNHPKAADEPTAIEIELPERMEGTGG